jgi:hypothetical protein
MFLTYMNSFLCYPGKGASLELMRRQTIDPSVNNKAQEKDILYERKNGVECVSGSEHKVKRIFYSVND